MRTTRSAIPIIRIFTSCCVCRWTWGKTWRCQGTAPQRAAPGAPQHTVSSHSSGLLASEERLEPFLAWPRSTWMEVQEVER